MNALFLSPVPARCLKVVIFCEIRDCLSGAKFGQAVPPGSAELLTKHQSPLGIAAVTSRYFCFSI